MALRRSLAAIGVIALVTGAIVAAVHLSQNDSRPNGAATAYYEHVPSTSVLAVATHAIASGDHCGTVTHASKSSPVPTPYRWCTYGNSVEYAPVGASIGLWYQEYAGLPQAPQVCVKHLGGGWWVMASEDAAHVVAPCPARFILTNGG